MIEPKEANFRFREDSLTWKGVRMTSISVSQAFEAEIFQNALLWDWAVSCGSFIDVLVIPVIQFLTFCPWVWAWAPCPPCPRPRSPASPCRAPRCSAPTSVPACSPLFSTLSKISQKDYFDDNCSAPINSNGITMRSSTCLLHSILNKCNGLVIIYKGIVNQ